MANDKKNEKELEAWNQWKVICSIEKCPAEQKEILTKAVKNAFLRKFHRTVDYQLDFLFSDKNYKSTKSNNEEKNKKLQNQSDSAENSAETDDNFSEELQKEPEGVNWAHIFDLGIIEKAISAKSPKNYKDHTWECIKTSDDPPLKIIKGQLLGEFGIINEIAERYIRVEYPSLWDTIKENRNAKQRNDKTSSDSTQKNDDDGKSAISIVSVDTQISNDSDTKEIDLIPAKKDLTILEDDEKEYLQKCFRNLFSNKDAAIFLVHITNSLSFDAKKISLAIPELKKYVGLASSAIYDRLNNIIKPKLRSLPLECQQSMQAAGAYDFIFSLIFNQIRPEKEAFPLLQVIRKTINNNREEICYE